MDGFTVFGWVVTLAGVYKFFKGCGSFGTNDGRTKTGYKDNVVPNKLKALGNVLIGFAAACIGIGILAQP